MRIIATSGMTLKTPCKTVASFRHILGAGVNWLGQNIVISNARSGMKSMMMPDGPVQRPIESPRGTLFDATSRLAGEAAAASIGSRREKILRFIRERGPATLFEIAAYYGWYDHQISGRFTELARDAMIERTGERRQKPETGCVADVWRIRDRPVEQRRDPADLQGYPVELVIPGDGRFVRWPVLETADLPGIPYCLHGGGGELALSYRVALVECDGCGRPLKQVTLVDGKDRKVYRCGTPTCNRTWQLQVVHEPGGVELLALVMKRM